MNKAELTANYKRLEKGGMLRTTADPSGNLSNAEAVSYFTLPPRSTSLGRVVVAFAHLSKSGHLDTAVPHAYGVIAQTLSEENPRSDNPYAVKRSQELHAIAEDLALKHGIFTPYGRLTAEVAVLEKLMPYVARPDFAAHRIANLDGLLASVEADSSIAQTSQDRIANELQRAKQHLDANYVSKA